MFAFFEALEANNNRPWFNDHKQQYLDIRARWIEQMQQLIAKVGEWWPEVKYTDAAASTFRIYRDIRFSTDKRPYKTHISTGIGPQLPADTGHFGFYIQAGTDLSENGIWGGIWHPSKEALRSLRNAISTNAEEWAEIVNDPEFKAVYGDRWWGESLKKAPKGFDPADPMIEYLRLKDIGIFAPITRRQFNSQHLADILEPRMRPLLPMMRFMHYTLTEE